jgi:hypothetical protein
VLREAQHVQAALHREVGLIAGIDPDRGELVGTGRVVQSSDPAQMDIAGDGERHQVRHHTPGGEHAPR